MPSATVNVASTRPASVIEAKFENVKDSPSGRARSPSAPPSPFSAAVTSPAPNVSAVPSYGLLFVGAVSVIARGFIFTVPFAVVIE